MAAKVDKNKCTGCGICVQACPVDAITVNHVAAIDAAACTECGSCVTECPNDAISIERIGVVPPSQKSPSLTPPRISAMRNPPLPAAPCPSVVQPRFQQVNRGGFLEQIFDFLGRFANQGCGQGFGLGKGGGGCRGRGKSRWR